MSNEDLLEDNDEDALRSNLWTSLHEVQAVQPQRIKSIARAQKLINKLKRFSESDRTETLNGLRALDVSMYLQEIAAALCDVSQIKLKDIMAMVEICVELKLIYGSDFTNELFNGLKRCQDQTTPGLKQRILARLLVELVLCGVIDDQEPIIVSWIVGWLEKVSSLTKFVNGCRTKNQQTHLALPAQILTWPEFGLLHTMETLVRKFPHQVFGLKGAANRTFQKCSQATLKGSLEKYVRQKSVVYLLLSHEALFNQEAFNQQQKLQRVSLDLECETRLTSLIQHKDRVTCHLQTLIEFLGVCKPLHFQSISSQISVMISQEDKSNLEYPIDHFPRFVLEEISTLCPLVYERYLSAANLSGVTRMNASAAEESHHRDSAARDYDPKAIETEVKWVDESERAFYENLTPLREFVPAPLLTMTSAKKADDDDELDSPEVSKREDSETEILLPETPASPSGLTRTLSDDLELLNKTSSAAARVLSPIEKFIDDFVRFATTCGFVDSSVASQVDGFVRDFCLKQLNSKSNRRKLIKAFLNTRRTDLHVLPAVSRFVAILGQHYQDLISAMTSSVLSEFHLLKDEKSPYKIEQKIKTTRFISELCKFQLIPIGTVLEILNALIDDFSPHSIEMVCHLLESCGRFIAGTRGGDIRLQNTLIKLKRMKSSKQVPSRLDVFLEDQQVMLEAACQRMTTGEIPPLWAKAVKRQCDQDDIPVMQKYVRHLIWNELGGYVADAKYPNLEHVRDIVKKLRKLDWQDMTVVGWVLDAFLSISYQVNVAALPNFSFCLATLAQSQAQFVVTCVDELLNRICLGFEMDESGQRQKRILECSLLAELFTDKVIDSYVLMDILFFAIGIHTTSTPFAASHFIAVIELIKLVGTSAEGQAYTADINQNVPPLDYALALLAAPSSSEELPNKLAELLYNVQLKCPFSKDETDFFRVHLCAHILKSCWILVSRRSWRWRLDIFIHALLYYFAWKYEEINECPMHTSFLLKEVLSECCPVYEKCDFTDKKRATITLSNTIKDICETLASLLTRPDSTMSNVQFDTTTIYSKISLSHAPSSSSSTGPGGATNPVNEDSARETGLDESESDTDQSGVASWDDDNGGRNAQSTIQFDRDLDTMISESIEAARQSAQFVNTYSKGATELRIPHQLLKNRSRITQQQTKDQDLIINTSSLIQGGDDDSPNSIVKFTLLTKKGAGGKFAIKQISTSADSRLAMALTKSVPDITDDSVDRQINKRFVMDHMDRLGAEEHRATQQNEVFARYKSVNPDDRPAIQTGSTLQQRLLASAYQLSGGRGSVPRLARMVQKSGKSRDKPIREAARKKANLHEDD